LRADTRDDEKLRSQAMRFFGAILFACVPVFLGFGYWYYPQFTLTDHHGRTVTEADFRGRTLLVYFGYTYCPDVCPTTLSSIVDAMSLLGEGADALVPILITIDPERDSAAALADYVGAFDPRIIGLTGTPEQIAAAARPFRVYYERNGTGADYTMDHSAFTYLLGPDGRRLEAFPHGTQAKEMAQALAARMNR
jgi:cytochrome oxidase Cu insertion factor (SCO1/SenC/PrrC family)